MVTLNMTGPTEGSSTEKVQSLTETAKSVHVKRNVSPFEVFERESSKEATSDCAEARTARRDSLPLHPAPLPSKQQLPLPAPAPLPRSMSYKSGELKCRWIAPQGHSFLIGVAVAANGSDYLCVHTDQVSRWRWCQPCCCWRC